MSGLLVALLLVSDACSHVLKPDLTIKLRDNRSVERIPHENRIAFLHSVAILEIEERTVLDRRCGKDNLGISINNPCLGETRDYNLTFLAFGVLAGHCLQVAYLDITVVT